MTQHSYDPEWDSPEARANFATRHIVSLEERRRRRDELKRKYEEEEVATGVRPNYRTCLSREKEAVMRAKGNARRRMLEEHLKTRSLEAVPAKWLSHDLSPELKDALGLQHPQARGGEDLPDLLDNEVEIARISLTNSVHGEVTSLRARLDPVGGAWHLRIVDEYETVFALRSVVSQFPLAPFEVVECFRDASPSPLETECSIDITSLYYDQLNAVANTLNIGSCGVSQESAADNSRALPDVLLPTDSEASDLTSRETSIRDLLKRDQGVDVRISAGIGRREDPFVVEACSVEEAANTQIHALRGLGKGLGELWRTVEWAACRLGSATEVIRIEAVRFTETEIHTETRGVYFDTRAVAGAPHSLHPVIAWRGPSGAPLLPFELGWLHFDQAFNNAVSGRAFDHTIFYSGVGAKASVYVYSRPSGGDHAVRDAELKRAAEAVLAEGVEDPWPITEVGAFALKYFLSGADMTAVGVAVSGSYFVKLRLTFFDDLKMRELMRETVKALAARLL